MPTLPVNAIYSGMQLDGHWTGTPALVVQLMEHPEADLPQPESLDGSFPLPEWEFDPDNEVSIHKLLDRTKGQSSAHFAQPGLATLLALATSYRERHVLIIARDVGRHEIAPFANRLIMAGRSVQIETTIMRPSLSIAKTWLSLLAMPARIGSTAAVTSEAKPRPDEIIACIRARADLDRTELAFGDRRIPVWLRPSPFADLGIHRQCITVATRHPGWRVTMPTKSGATV